MIIIPITNIPNQSLSFTANNNQYDLRIHSARDTGTPGTGIMTFDISINSNVVVTGIRAVAGFPIIPSAYLQNGNFIVLTDNDDYPDWRQFGISQQLIYASQSELQAIQT
jgi:hypothetical protein